MLEYVISGKGHLHINGKDYTVGPGDVYCVEPGYDHAYWSDRDDPYDKIWINFFSSHFTQVMEAYGLHERFVFRDSQCRHYFQNLLQISRNTFDSDQACYPVCALIQQILCTWAERINGKAVVSDTAREIKSMLDNALYSNLSIDEISKKLFISKMQISRIFSGAYGQTPYNYLLDNKISIAKRFLLSTSLNVSEISSRLAFSDPHYFSRIFKKKTGSSPAGFRAANGFSSKSIH